MAVTHAKVSVITDGADTSLVQPSNWNADHTINSILPATDSAYDLGSATYRWQDAYVETIKFPATQVPSSDVNTLDDYEEADYIPSGNVITFTLASGRYTKIGRLVVVQFNVVWPATSDSSEARISLPFTNGGSVSAAAIWMTSLSLTARWVVVQSQNYLKCWDGSSTASANSVFTEDQVFGSVTYSL